jgi:hypothetical protein
LIQKRGVGLKAAEHPVEIFVKLDPPRRLNYSLLHNRSNLFTSFRIQKSQESEVPEIDVHVELCVGETTFPYRASFKLEDLLTDLSDEISVPLVASMLRGLRENIRTSLYVRVKHREQVIHSSTHRVTLLPGDEWLDDESDWKWLPSFVLPRDTAILAILGKAERYLRTLADDSCAGFDGYQRLSEGRPETDIVDNQVRAIWASLLYDSPLSYINPPPTYTASSQRLRTPGMVLAEKRGTCIDLALLFAACLEYIGLNPVIFLIKGHAFPGYWRRPEDQEKLRSFANFGDLTAHKDPPQESFEGRISQSEPWVFAGAEAFREIAEAVSAGGLVPIETVQLTERGGFSKAMELGLKNLTTPWGFDALVDIQIAREKDITPLPLFQNEH